jgi:hypothetical protein
MKMMRIRDIVEKEGRDQGHPLSHLISLVLQIQTQVTVHQIIEGRSIDTKRPVTVLKISLKRSMAPRREQGTTKSTRKLLSQCQSPRSGVYPVSVIYLQ